MKNDRKTIIVEIIDGECNIKVEEGIASTQCFGVLISMLKMIIQKDMLCDDNDKAKEVKELCEKLYKVFKENINWIEGE